MWNKAVYLITFICLSLTSIDHADAQEEIWKSVSYGIRDSGIRMVQINPVNPDIVYAGSRNTVYKTTDGGKKWDKVFSFRRTARTIHTIALNSLSPDIVYAGTKEGLYKSNNEGASWTRIFQGIRKSERSVLSIAVSPHDPAVIFIGTESGIYRTVNEGKDWEKMHNFPSRTSAFSIAIDNSDPHIIYVVTDRELYKSLDGGAGWEKIYSVGRTTGDSRTVSVSDKIEINGKEIKIEHEFEFEFETKVKRMIMAIAIDPADSLTLYIGTSKGLLASKDGGASWTTLSNIGLISDNIRHFIIKSDDADNLYAATNRGVFRYSKVKKKWDALYQGMITVDIRHIDIAGTTAKFNNLWAVTKRGVYKTILSKRKEK